MTVWRSNRVPPAPHPFCHFIASDEWVMITGLGGHDEHGNLPESAADQARAAFEKIKRILEAEGSGMHEIVWMSPYVTATEYALETHAVLQEYFPDPTPACGALVVVGLFDPRMKVEYDVWAHKGAKIVADERPVIFPPAGKGAA